MHGARVMQVAVNLQRDQKSSAELSSQAPQRLVERIPSNDTNGGRLVGTGTCVRIAKAFAHRINPLDRELPSP